MVTLIILVAVFVPMIQRLGGTANRTVLGGADESMIAGAGESQEGHVFEDISDDIAAFKPA